MLVRPWDRALDPDEWRPILAARRFGDLVAGGRDRDVPVVVPTPYSLVGDEVLIHLATTNPVWDAIAEHPRVVLSVSADDAYVPGHWKAIGDEDPALGIPTTLMAVVQVTATVSPIDDPDGLLAVLRATLADHGDTDLADPAVHQRLLGSIRAIRLPLTEVVAKVKAAGNLDAAHRAAIADRLEARGGPNDVAAAGHVRRRAEARREPRR
ncbi:FMN-binding negative transcriptional regulator [Nitriliruptoraceae bacterium ZYF776]|nr:FMN-binding negative transcriptional regulator [Profundirhabdus halotolerans]